MDSCRDSENDSSALSPSPELAESRRIPAMARHASHPARSSRRARGTSRSARQIRIAGFELIRKIGQGGMGAVYLAKQVSMDRLVALKLLPPKLAREEKFVRQFLREARTSARLNHPNVISGIDVGESNGLYYFAMEYVSGHNMRRMLADGGPLPEFLLLQITEQVTSVLIYSERIGLVHRDIKPDNIMIDERGRVKLLDLGLATTVDAARRADDGRAVGTPNYISPEQAVGGAKIDTRADIYCLGATLYHLASGRTMFTGHSREALYSHVHHAAPNVLEFRKDLDPGFAFMLEHMLAKEADDRYLTAAELMEDAMRLKEGLAPLAASKPRVTSSMVPTTELLEAAGRSYSPGRRKYASTLKKLLPYALAASLALILSAAAYFALFPPAADGNIVPRRIGGSPGETSKNAVEESYQRPGDSLSGKTFSKLPPDGISAIDRLEKEPENEQGSLMREHPGGETGAQYLTSPDATIKATEAAGQPPPKAAPTDAALSLVLSLLGKLVEDIQQQGWGEQDFPALLARAEAVLSGKDGRLSEQQRRRWEFTQLKIIEASESAANSLLKAGDKIASVDNPRAAEFLEARAKKLLPRDCDKLLGRASLYRLRREYDRRMEKLAKLNNLFEEMKARVAEGDFEQASAIEKKISSAKELVGELEDWETWSRRVELLFAWKRWNGNAGDAPSERQRALATPGALEGNLTARAARIYLGAVIYLALQERWRDARSLLNDSRRPDFSAFDEIKNFAAGVVRRVEDENRRLDELECDRAIDDWKVTGAIFPADAVTEWPRLRDRFFDIDLFQQQYPSLSATLLVYHARSIAGFEDRKRRSMYFRIQREARNSAVSFAGKLEESGAPLEVTAGFYMRGGSVTHAQGLLRTAHNEALRSDNRSKAVYLEALLLQTKLAHGETGSLAEAAKKILSGVPSPDEKSSRILRDLLNTLENNREMENFYKRYRNIIHTRHLDADTLWKFCEYARRYHHYLAERCGLEFLVIDYPDSKQLRDGRALLALFRSRYGQAQFMEALDALAALQFFARSSPEAHEVYINNRLELCEKEILCLKYAGRRKSAEKRLFRVLQNTSSVEDSNLAKHLRAIFDAIF